MAAQYQKTTFQNIFDSILTATGFNVSDAYKVIRGKGVNISYAALNKYTKFTRVPSFTTAKSILSAFNFTIKDSDLADVLQYSRTQLKHYGFNGTQYYQPQLRLNPERFGNFTPAQFSELLDMRIRNGGYNSLNDYISSLIEQDLALNHYISAQTEEGEHHDN